MIPGCLPFIAGTVHIPNPAFDYIPPHLISLFITDSGMVAGTGTAGLIAGVSMTTSGGAFTPHRSAGSAVFAANFLLMAVCFGCSSHVALLSCLAAGGYTPSYVYRLLTDTYSREDYLLSKELHFGR
jgi:hypothetical protein